MPEVIKNNIKQRVSKILSLTFIFVTVLFFITLFTQKDKLLEHASELNKELYKDNLSQEHQESIKSEFDLANSQEAYQITFLEFGSTGCVACRKMEKVLEDIKEGYPSEIQVIFHNVTKEESKDYVIYFNVVAIPTQILLDKNGREFFRHTGFIPTEALIKEINKQQY